MVVEQNDKFESLESGPGEVSPKENSEAVKVESPSKWLTALKKEEKIRNELKKRQAKGKERRL